MNALVPMDHPIVKAARSAAEKPTILVTRTGGFLRGAAPLDDELIRELPAAKALKATFVQPRRSSQQNRLYWALLKVVCENLDEPLQPEAMHGWLKLRLGYFHSVRLRSGETVQIPASTAFDQMSHGDFTVYFNAAKTLITAQIIPHLHSDKLELAAREMLGEEL